MSKQHYAMRCVHEEEGEELRTGSLRRQANRKESILQNGKGDFRLFDVSEEARIILQCVAQVRKASEENEFDRNKRKCINRIETHRCEMSLFAISLNCTEDRSRRRHRKQ